MRYLEQHATTRLIDTLPSDHPLRERYNTLKMVIAARERREANERKHKEKRHAHR